MDSNKRALLSGLPLVVLAIYFFNNNYEELGYLFSSFAVIVIVISLTLIIKKKLDK